MELDRHGPPRLLLDGDEPHPADSARPGLSLVAFLAGAWLAAIGARALSPALPGSAIGIADLIRSTQFGAACVSQLVAAGGIALLCTPARRGAAVARPSAWGCVWCLRPQRSQSSPSW